MRALSRSGLSLAAVALVVIGACGSEPDAARIDDRAFARAAEELCARELPPLRADIADDEPRDPEEVAPTIEARADSLESLVRGLRGIEVGGASRGAVETWLDDWDTYVDVGRRYARALREGNPRRYAAVADEGMAPQARISAFARANNFKSCALDGVPLPPREGL
ncbi:MAG TPA: hypothetical protein VMY88_09160 [Acidimicrobiales bacterium]|nr:hypothetical protein [Acidimicrobiales bacterium]